MLAMAKGHVGFARTSHPRRGLHFRKPTSGTAGSSSKSSRPPLALESCAALALAILDWNTEQVHPGARIGPARCGPSHSRRVRTPQRPTPQPLRALRQFVFRAAAPSKQHSAPQLPRQLPAQGLAVGPFRHATREIPRQRDHYETFSKPARRQLNNWRARALQSCIPPTGLVRRTATEQDRSSS